MMALSGDFRKIALVVILLRAGFELRRDVMHRVERAALIMSCLPAVFEIAGIMLVAPKWLDLSYLDAAISGSILAAVSPAVVVPLMIEFMQRGRGSQKGIPMLVLGAPSLDDVFVMVLFTILLGMATGTSAAIGWQLAQIPISVVLGILIGLIPGIILVRLFTRFDWRPPQTYAGGSGGGHHAYMGGGPSGRPIGKCCTIGNGSPIYPGINYVTTLPW